MEKSDTVQPLKAAGQFNSSYDKFSAQPINGALGAEISGLDLSKPLDPVTLDQLRQALLNHLVLVFRDQTLSSEQLVATGRQFGELHVNPFVKPVDGHPEIMPVKSAENAEKKFTGLWHSDTTWEKSPSLGSLLYAKEIPEFGGDTLFANMYLAYETLSKGMRDMLNDMMAEHSYIGHFTGKAEHADAPDAVTHPVIRTHPETGRKLLFVNEYFTQCFASMSREESMPILQYLFEHAVRPDFTCRITWQPKTLIFWDNRATQHYATNDYAGQSREMHRITVIGDEPY